MQLEAAWPTHLAGVNGGATPPRWESTGPWEESQSFVRMPIITRLRSSLGSRG